jgi:hypothetical protein
MYYLGGVQMICKNCLSEIPEGSVFCNKCGTKIASEPTKKIDSICTETEPIVNNILEVKSDVKNKKWWKKKSTIIIAIILTFIVSKIAYYYIRLSQFSHELMKQMREDMYSTGATLVALDNSSLKYKNLILTFPDEFDKKSSTEKAAILKDIWNNYDTKRYKLMFKYDLYNRKASSEKRISEFSNVIVKTSTKTYSHDLHNFTDADGKEIRPQSQYASGSYSSSSSTGITSTSNSSTGGQVSDDEKLFAWMAAEKIVKQNLKAPSTAKFPFSYNSTSVEIKKIDANTFRVNAYVDAENSYGAIIRNNFTITIVKSGSGNFTYKDYQMY